MNRGMLAVIVLLTVGTAFCHDGTDIKIDTDSITARGDAPEPVRMESSEGGRGMKNARKYFYVAIGIVLLTVATWYVADLYIGHETLYSFLFFLGLALVFLGWIPCAACTVGGIITMVKNQSYDGITVFFAAVSVLLSLAALAYPVYLILEY